MLFHVFLHSDDGKNYGVTVPDLPGCFSGGDSIDAALKAVKEAIEFHVEGMIASNMELPRPVAVEVHRANPIYANSIWLVVDVAVDKHFAKASHSDAPQFAQSLDGIHRRGDFRKYIFGTRS